MTRVIHRPLQMGHSQLAVSRRVGSSCAASVGWAVHDHAVLVWIGAGRLTMELGATWSLGPGDLLLMPAGAPHRLTLAADVDGWNLGLCTTCFGRALDGRLVAAFHDVAGGACPVRRARSDEAFDAAFVRLEAAAAGAGSPDDLALVGALASLMAEVERAAPAAPEGTGGAMPSTVGEAVRFIERRALDPISLADVADAVGRTPNHVATAVKQHTGRTVGDWIVSVRMTEARRRLLHSEELVEIVAERVGYASASRFHRVFREAHGETPAAWRRRHRAR